MPGASTPACAIGLRGTGLGLLAILLLPSTADAGGFFDRLGFQGWHWIVPLVIPFLLVGWRLPRTGAAARRTPEDLA